MAKAKLTLSINPDIIARAKLAAQKDGMSLSRLVERYLTRLTKTFNTESPNPDLDAITGILDLPDDFDHKKAIAQYLEDKYLK